MKNQKIGVREVPEGDLRAPYIGWAGRFLGLGTQPLAALLGVRFVQVHQLRAPAMRSQSFAPLIYGAPVCKLHRSLYRGISTCPTRNSLTFTCGLRLSACRMLVTTMSFQSRQEIHVTQPSNQSRPNAAPSDTNNEKTTINNFLANKICVNWILVAAVLILTGAAIHFYTQAQNISYEHLNKTRQSLQEIKEFGDVTNKTIEEINSLRNSFSIQGLRLILSLIAFTSCFSKPIMKLLNKCPQRVFVSIIALGGILAFSIPQYLYSFKYIGETKDITTSLLTVTGGILAVFTLLKTHQKSELEREQLDTQKKKDDRDHIRQLHNSYNDRFDKALVELHGDDTKATYAAVPKLAKLADSWLDYEDLSNDREELEKLKKKAKKEAQTIINILCKYIRAMPGKYTEKDLEDIPNLSTADQDKLKNESEVRRLIFSEMSDRSSKDTFENEKLSTTLWSELDFDFSRAPIFYPLNNLTIEKGIFTSAKFYGNADFSGSTFIRDTSFNGVQFTKEAIFNEVTFNGKADFSTQGDVKTTFGGKATFNGAQFIQEANFNEVTFNKAADFSTQGDTKTTFEGDATFNGAHFTQEANFNEVTFNKVADFSGPTGKNTIFKEKAIFIGAHFSGKSFFNNISFEGVVDFSSKDPSYPAIFSDQTEFSDTTFASKADFTSLVVDPSQYSSGLVFQKVFFKGEAIFKNVRFSQSVEFKETEFQEGANFEYAVFSGATKFARKIIFKQEANFNSSEFHISLEINAHFEKNANFISTIFGPESSSLQKISFNESRFTGDTDFSGAHFNLDTDFIDVIFEGETNFTEAVFLGNSSFTRSYDGRNITGRGLFSKFKKEARFQGADFMGSVDFSHMRFCSSAIFEEAKFGSDTYFNNMYFDTIPPDFKDAEFEAKSKHSFTTNLNSNEQFNLRAIKPNSKGQKVWLPSGSFLFTNTPGNLRIGPA